MKTSDVVSGVLGLFVGFPRKTRVVYGFARCLMCKVYVSIPGRSFQNLWDHWKGDKHTRPEQNFRIMTQRRLLDKLCGPVSAYENRQIRVEQMTEPPLYLEALLGWSLMERVALEQDLEAEADRLVLTCESYLWFWCFFVNGFAEVTNFQSLLPLNDVWPASMRGEVSLVERSLLYVKAQINDIFLPCSFSVVD